MKMIIKINLLAALYSIYTFLSWSVIAVAEENNTMTIDIDGCNLYTVLEDNTVYYQNLNNKTEPQRIADDAIALSKNYILKKDGTLWRWNYESKQLQFVSNDVTEVSSNTSASYKPGMTATTPTVLFVKQDKTLWGYGNNYFGQLGQGNVSTIDSGLLENTIFTRKNISHFKCLPEYIQEPIKIMDHISEAEVGQTHSIVLSDEGDVYTFGTESYGELGDGRDINMTVKRCLVLENIKKIFTSGAACFAVDQYNKCYIWGSNYIDYVGKTANTCYPTNYLDDVRYIYNKPGCNFVIKTDGSLWIAGDAIEGYGEWNNQQFYAPIKLMNNVDCVIGSDLMANNEDFTIVLKTDGSLYLLDDIKLSSESTVKKTLIAENIKTSEGKDKDTCFDDLDECSNAEERAIIKLYKCSIINGVTSNEFRPQNILTRGECATLLLRLICKDNRNEICTYTDVTMDKWYYNIAGSCQKYGIIEGYDDNTFRGEEAVSDVQLVVLAARTLRNEGTAIEHKEIKEISLKNVPSWAQSDVEYAYKHNLITEEEVNKLSGKEITRGESSVILYRLYREI
ncbi:MAG: S-layer homology domain-containing protein [Clostridia bacterium]|nr:S-layer homology domain-containing protein [Clostridia bacterium]